MLRWGFGYGRFARTDQLALSSNLYDAVEAFVALFPSAWLDELWGGYLNLHMIPIKENLVVVGLICFARCRGFACVWPSGGRGSPLLF